MDKNSNDLIRESFSRGDKIFIVLMSTLVVFACICIPLLHHTVVNNDITDTFDKKQKQSFIDCYVLESKKDWIGLIHNEIVSDDGKLCESNYLSLVSSGNTFTYYNSQKIHVKLSLVDSEKINTPQGIQTKQFLQELCPEGYRIHVDEDNGISDNRYTYAKIYCNSQNQSLNEIVIGNGYGTIDKQQCETSEFAKEDWAVKHGCYFNRLD